MRNMNFICRRLFGKFVDVNTQITRMKHYTHCINETNQSKKERKTTAKRECPIFISLHLFIDFYKAVQFI